MPKSRTLTLRFPGMGVIRRFVYERQYSAVDYPCAWAVSVRLEGGLSDRLRGGSFTGDSAPSSTEARYPELATENGDTIITENGDTIVLGPQYYYTAGDGGAWRAPGDDAATNGDEDCLYRDRVLIADSNIIYASEKGVWDNWTCSDDVSNPSRPTFFQLSESGKVGEDVVALVPHKDSYLIGFTSDETWVLKGDPTTGSLRNVSREVGIIAAKAWCKREDTVYFLSSRGLYSVSADGSGLKAVSADKIPEELEDLTDSGCTLSYNHEDRGCYIHLTSGPSWFYDTERDQFWPFDTSSTDSHLLIGPLRLGDALSYGMIQQIHGIMATSSAAVQWRIVPGDTAEEAAYHGKTAITLDLAGGDYDEYISSSGAWDAGRSPIGWPRATSMWACIWLYSAGSWSYENISLVVAPFGRWRG